MRIALAIILVTVLFNLSTVQSKIQPFDQLHRINADIFAAHSMTLTESQAENINNTEIINDLPSTPLLDEIAFNVRPEAEHDLNALLFDPLKMNFNKSISADSDIPFIVAAIKESKAQGVDLELILSVIEKESQFDPKARSRAGAVGLMQVMPSTAKWLGLKDKSQLWTPEVNIKYGVKYLRYLWKQFGKGDFSQLTVADLQNEGLIKTIAAYNAGPGNVKKYNGVPPFRETRNYLKKIKASFKYYENL
ncbi:MAG: lytic transglycosylase domain-containing protein [Elusimicrobiales bacterium]|nr:lytic transglycosylase domain-containing protein [Elusimicrobiales bacterium]MCK5583739.1 lytic transglycosylase domain-containing protein [Elusimicrobiales bacterium]